MGTIYGFPDVKVKESSIGYSTMLYKNYVKIEKLNDKIPCKGQLIFILRHSDKVHKAKSKTIKTKHYRYKQIVCNLKKTTKNKKIK